MKIKSDMTSEDHTDVKPNKSVVDIPSESMQ